MITRMGPEAAEKVVFLHGGVINRQMWLPVIELLCDDFDCIAIDLPGHGALADEAFSMEGSRRRLGEILDDIGVERAVLAGLSLGGYVALDFASEYPNRVRGLLLSGATVTYTGWTGLTTRLYGLAFPIIARKAGRAFAQKLEADLDPVVSRAILEAGLSMRGGAAALRNLPGIDYAAKLGRSSVPIVIANGERDTPNRAGESRFLDLHPQAKSTVIENAGHACALTQPAAFARAVRAVMEEMDATWA